MDVFFHTCTHLTTSITLAHVLLLDLYCMPWSLPFILPVNTKLIAVNLQKVSLMWPNLLMLLNVLWWTTTNLEIWENASMVLWHGVKTVSLFCWLLLELQDVAVRQVLQGEEFPDWDGADYPGWPRRQQAGSDAFPWQEQRRPGLVWGQNRKCHQKQTGWWLLFGHWW